MTQTVKERPILFSGEMVKAILEGRKTQTRRVVTERHCRSGLPSGALVDLSRAYADHGFPTDDDGEVLPMHRWADTSESSYHYHYLHVPYAHPEDGWEKDPRDDVLHRVYCPYGQPGDRLWVRETWAPADTLIDGFERDDPVCVAYKADLSIWRHEGGEQWDVGSEHVNWEHPDRKWRPSIHMPRWASRITLEVTGVRVERLQDISDADVLAEGVEQHHIDKFKRFPEIHPSDIHGWAFSELWDSINGKTYPWESNPYVWVIEFRRVEQ